MELPDVGQHCSYAACNKLDFLPFTCELCKKVFCLDHHGYEGHSCPERYRVDAQVPVCPLCNNPVPSKRGQPPDLAVNEHMENNCRVKQLKIYTNKCSALGCKVKELLPVQCDSCGLNYCLRHRHVADHSCKGPQTRQEFLLNAAMNRKEKGSGSGVNKKEVLKSSYNHTRVPPNNVPRPVATVSSLQGTVSEEEALRLALKASVQVSGNTATTRNNLTSMEEEDYALAAAIAASLNVATPNTTQGPERRKNEGCCVA